jgi:hypothetical protein
MAAVKPQPCQPSQLRLGYNSFIRWTIFKKISYYTIRNRFHVHGSC